MEGTSIPNSDGTGEVPKTNPIKKERAPITLVQVSNISGNKQEKNEQPVVHWDKEKINSIIAELCLQVGQNVEDVIRDVGTAPSSTKYFENEAKAKAEEKSFEQITKEKFIRMLTTINKTQIQQEIAVMDPLDLEIIFNGIFGDQEIFNLFMKYYPDFFARHAESFSDERLFLSYLDKKGDWAVQSQKGFVMEGDQFLTNNFLLDDQSKIYKEKDYPDTFENLLKSAISTVEVLSPENSVIDIRNNRKREKFKNLFHKLHELEDKIVKTFDSEEYRPIAVFLLRVLDFDFAKTERIINAQIDNYLHLAQLDSDRKPYFPNHLLKFCINYADISQELAQRFPIEGQREEIEQKSRELFSEVLNSKELFTAQGEGDSPINLFEVLVSIIKEQPEKFPWFPYEGDLLKDTPFDKKSLSNLITPELPRLDLIQSLKELCLYKDVREYEKLLSHYNAYQDSIYRKLGPDNLKKIVKKMKYLLDSFPDNIAMVGPIKDEDSNQEIIQRYEALLEYLNDELRNLDVNIPPIKDFETDQNSVEQVREIALSKMHIFLRLFHPKTIARNVDVQADAIEFIDYLKNNIDNLSQNDKNRLILSFEKLLYRKADEESFDFDMDIQLRVGRGSGKQTFRSFLEKTCLEIFDDEIVAHGMKFDSFAHKFVKGDKPIFPLLGQLMMEIGYDDAIGNKFNSAEKGTPKGHLFEAARREIKTIKKTSLEGKSWYQKTLDFCKNTMTSVFQARRSGEVTHDFYIDSTATTAFERFFSQCIDFGPQDNVIFSKEEYQSIINVPLKSSKNKDAVRFFDLHTIEFDGTERAATGDEIFERICDLINENTKMIDLSSLTRLGNIPLAGKGTKKGSVSSLRKLIEALKEKYPDIPFMIDASQAIGRIRLDDLGTLNPDIYLFSGNKAMGTKQAGFIALSRSFKQKLEEQKRSFVPQEDLSTIPLEESVAFAKGLRELTEKIDPYCLEGNQGENKKKTLDQKIFAKMKFLTAHTLRKAECYSLEFIQKNQSLVKEYLKSDEYESNPIPPETLFSCEIFNPLPQSSSGNRILGGEVVVYFPNISGERISNKLKKDDLEVKSLGGPEEHPISKEKARKKMIRISFEYPTTIEDIDMLFDKMMDTHREALTQKIADGKEHIWKYLSLDHEYNPMEWHSD